MGTQHDGIVRAWTLGLMLLGGCSGQVGGETPDGTGPGKPGGAMAGGSGGTPGTPGVPGTPGTPGPPGDTTVPPGPIAACKPGGGGLTLRRLNRDEYDNTVRDLLGDSSRPGRNFPADISSEGFDNNASTLTVPPILAETYESAAERLVDEVWTRDAGAAAAARKVRMCDPVAGKEKDCAKQILDAFLPRAWRRPVTTDEVARLTALVDVAKMNGQTGERGIKLALQAALMSPHFLFRVEADGDPTKPAGQYALASRLSYFVWGSMPDAPLVAAAAAGTLHNPEVIRKEVKRMLADPKADALITQFAGQWLDLRLIEGINPDDKLFPGITPTLKRSMRQESEQFFKAFLTEDRSALDMIDANFTFLNQELMQHYGLWETNARSPNLQRVTLPPTSKRAGWLGHGTFLGVTSMADRTSVVLRGHWVMQHLLCEEPPPAPANVPPLPATVMNKPATQRERTELHRQDPACAACHKVMDPIGFGLENFDAVGRWRDNEGGGLRIDARGDYKGKAFDGPRQLAAAIKSDPSFASCMVQKVYSYALGKTVGTEDAQALQALTKTFADKQHRLGELLTETAASPRFIEPCGR